MKLPFYRGGFTKAKQNAGSNGKHRGQGNRDPSFSNVTLLVSGIGSNNSTTIPDLSEDNRGNATVTGNAKITTSSPITGMSSSITFDDSGDNLLWNHVNFSNPSTAAAVWTFEAIVKPSADGSVFGLGDDWTGAGTFGAFLQFVAGGTLRFYSYWGWDITTAAVWSAGTEYFVAADSNGSKVRLYFGTLAGGTVTMVGSAGSAPDKSLYCSRVRIGSYGFGGDWGGLVNWVRFTDQVARYGSDGGGTIPTFPLPTS